MNLNNTYLYKKDSKDKIRQWKAYSDYSLDGNNALTVIIEHGQQDGKLQTKERKVLKGKNIGKANETTQREQTDLEIGYLYQKQLDDGYVQDINEYKEPRRPILAHKYQDRGKSVDWTKEQYASTKLDGIRCFIFVDDAGECVFESRTGKSFKYFKHLVDSIKEIGCTNCILDGELYSEDIPFEQICSLVNSDDYNEATDKEIKFYIYDMILNSMPEETFKDRYIRYSNTFIKDTNEHIKTVVQSIVKSEEEMKALAALFVAEGYEGLMLKSGEGKYDFGKRSINLLKYKEMHSDEFKIKDIFVAENDPGRVQIELYVNPFESEETFKIGTLKGNKEDNYNNYYLNKNNLIGKWLTISYQTLTSYGIPLFPVGINIRDGEVINNKFIPSV